VTLAEFVHSDLKLLLLDVVVLFVLGTAGESLPGETASQEIKKHVTNCLQVISPRLLVADVSVDARITGSASQILTLSERDVLSVRVLVALGETEIDNEDIVLV
jgi:hypothetical protein